MRVLTEDTVVKNTFVAEQGEAVKAECEEPSCHFALMLQIQGKHNTVNVVCDTLESPWRAYPRVGDSYSADVAFIFDQQIAAKLKEGLGFALPRIEAEPAKITVRVQVGPRRGDPLPKGHLAGGQPQEDRDA